MGDYNYGGKTFATEEVAWARATLIGVASLGQTVSYSEWADWYGWTDYVGHRFLAQPHNDIRRIGLLAGLISSMEAQHGRPLLTAVVVNGGNAGTRPEGQPGQGFDVLVKEHFGTDYIEKLGAERVWDHEIGRVYAYWSVPRLSE